MWNWITRKYLVFLLSIWSYHNVSNALTCSRSNFQVGHILGKACTQRARISRIRGRQIFLRCNFRKAKRERPLHFQNLHYTSSFVTVFSDTGDDDFNVLKNASDNLLVIDFLCFLCLWVLRLYVVKREERNKWIFYRLYNKKQHIYFFFPLSSSFNWPCFTRLPFKGFVFIFKSLQSFQNLFQWNRRWFAKFQNPERRGWNCVLWEKKIKFQKDELTDTYTVTILFFQINKTHTLYSLIEWQFKEGKFWKRGEEDNVVIEESYRAKRSKIIVDHGWNTVLSSISIDGRCRIKCHTEDVLRFNVLWNWRRSRNVRRRIKGFWKIFWRKIWQNTNIFEDYKDGDKVMGGGRCACTWGSWFGSMDISSAQRLCNAKTQASFAFEEFALGMAKLNCTTIKALKTKLMTRSKTTVKDFSDFEDLYMYAFVYMKEGANESKGMLLGTSFRSRGDMYVTNLWVFSETKSSKSTDEGNQETRGHKCWNSSAISKRIWRDMTSILSFGRQFWSTTQKRKEETSTTNNATQGAIYEDDMDCSI